MVCLRWVDIKKGCWLSTAAAGVGRYSRDRRHHHTPGVHRREGGTFVSIYEYHPHPYIRERAKRGPVRVEDQHKTSGLLGRFNKRVGVLITVIVGTMWCAYLFTALALISLPAAIKTGDRIVIVAWIAQTFLQLVLLPIIIVGQNVQAQAADKRSEQTYKDAEAVLHEALEIQSHLTAQDKILMTLHPSPGSAS
jgi:hypothetical protein